MLIKTPVSATTKTNTNTNTNAGNYSNNSNMKVPSDCRHLACMA